MEVTQVEAFVCVAQERSFTGAGRLLHLSQPAVSMRLSALEKELGVTLFVRKGRYVELTQAGAAFLPYAKKATEMLEHARAAAVTTKISQEGHLVMGCANSAAPFVIPRVIPEFTQRYPETVVSIRGGTSREVRHMVLDGLAEFGLITEPPIQYPGLSVQPIYPDSLVWVVGPHHPLASRAEVTVSELCRHTLASFDPSSRLTQYMHDWLAAQGVSPPIRVTCDELEFLQVLLRSNCFIGVLPECLARPEIEAGSLRALPVLPPFAIERYIHLVTTRGSRPSVNCRRFLRLLGTTFPQKVIRKQRGARSAAPQSLRPHAG